MRRVVLGVTLCCFAAAIAPAQWTIQDSHSTAGLRGIDNVGGGVAWASGTNGTVLRTVDDGASWQACAIPPGAEKLDFRGVQGFDAQTAIVMSSGKGDLSRLYKTTDGCTTWTLMLTNPDADGFWDAIQFSDAVPRTGAEGWILGDPVNGAFRLWHGALGGWGEEGKTRGLEASSGLQGAFAASNTSLLLPELNPQFPIFASGGTAGAFVYIRIGEEYKTPAGCGDPAFRDEECAREAEEAGLDIDVWKRIRTPIAAGRPSAGIFSLAKRELAPAVELIVAVGGDYEKPESRAGTAAHSRDNGNTWHAAQTPPHGYRSAVAYDAGLKTWITVGPNGTDISSDDGRNWRAVHPDAALHEPADADRNWNALSLPFVVGPHGRIGKLDPAALNPEKSGK